MGFFSRLGALIRGFFGLFVGDLEEKNPEVLFEDIKNQVEREIRLRHLFIHILDTRNHKERSGSARSTRPVRA